MHQPDRTPTDHRSRRRRLITVPLAAALIASLLAFAAADLAAPGVASADPAPTVTGEPCAPGVGVTVVVDFQALGQVQVGCAPGQQADGFAALTNAGFTFNEDGGPVAGTVCQIGRKPAAGYPACWYSGFWGYWKSNGAQTWQWSDVGAGDGPLAVDRVEGWSWTSPVPADYSGTPMRLAVADLPGLLADPADCTAVPQLPTFDIVSNAEVLPVTLADGYPVEVAVLTDPAADISTATWTTASSVALSGSTGPTRILARHAGSVCATNPVFDATYDVRTAYTPRWNAAAGTAGSPSNAIDKADARFKGWITGHSEYTPGGNVDATWRVPANAYGPVDSSLVVLGDRGSYTATFAAPITNGPGYDFAAFENGFASGAGDFIELAYLEVSSNGTDFVRFDSASRRTTTVGAFAAQNPAEIGGLPGKDLSGKGTPFDLSVLKNKPEVRSGAVNLHRITHVRLKDIKGDGADKDSFGRPIYDPNPVTGSAGYDLTGIGVLNVLDEVAPTVTITGGPTGTVNATTAQIPFTVNEPSATVERRLDGGAWVATTSPVTLSGLAAGAHTVDIRATDPSGNVGSASRSWAISSVSLGVSPAVPVIGERVTLTATIASTAKGSVAFFADATQLGKANVTGGVAKLNTTKLAPGDHVLTAAFTPTGSTTVDTSPAVAQQVERGETTATLAAAPVSTVYGQATKLTATIAPQAPAVGRPAGSVAFYDAGELIGTVTTTTGKATLTVSRAVGNHPITAVYAGSANWVGSAAAPLSHDVGRASSTTTVTSSANPAVLGQTVLIRVKAAPVAPSKAKVSGTIDLYDGATLVASKASTSGSVTFSLVPTLGSHSYSAVYRGNDGVDGSSGSIDQVVQQAATTTTATAPAAPTAAGKSALIRVRTAPVAPSRTKVAGTIDLIEDGNVIESKVVTAGTTTFTLKPTAGTHTYTAVFRATDGLASSAGTVTHVVTGPATA